jgi:hypothetical protein
MGKWMGVGGKRVYVQTIGGKKVVAIGKNEKGQNLFVDLKTGTQIFTVRGGKTNGLKLHGFTTKQAQLSYTRSKIEKAREINAYFNQFEEQERQRQIKEMKISIDDMLSGEISVLQKRRYAPRFKAKEKISRFGEIKSRLAKKEGQSWLDEVNIITTPKTLSQRRITQRRILR